MYIFNGECFGHTSAYKTHQKYGAWQCFCVSRPKYMPWLSPSRAHLMDTASISLPLIGRQSGHRRWKSLAVCPSHALRGLPSSGTNKHLPEAHHCFEKGGKNVICAETCRWWFITPLLSIRLLLYLIKARWRLELCMLAPDDFKGIKWTFVFDGLLHKCPN